MELRDTILDDPSTLKRSAHIYENIKVIAENILSDIRDKIYSASQEGQNRIIYEIPVIVQVTGLSNKETQYIVLALIIKALNKKNYDISVQPEDHVVHASITWLSKKDKEYIENCKRVVDEHHKVFVKKESS